MYETIYHRPKSLAEAADLFGAAVDARYISGGQTLLPTMKQRLAAPSDLIDLSKLAELRGVTVAGDAVTIGAATTHADAAASAELRSAIPGLAALAGMIGDPAVRHRGTIGGSLANNDPAADYPAAVLALDATITTNRRVIAAKDFSTGLFSTILEDGEIVTKVTFPVPVKSAYQKFRNPASRYAMAGAFVAVMKDGGVRVGITGAGSRGVFRELAFEKALSAKLAPESLDALTVDPAGMLSDIHGSAAYRANLVKVMAKRAVAALR